jgi:hypothetical protein
MSNTSADPYIYDSTTPPGSTAGPASATTTAGIAHGAGANPSTAAGIVVLMALGGLLLIRRSFRRIA